MNDTLIIDPPFGRRWLGGLISILACCLVGMLNMPAEAGITTYNSQAAWEAANPGFDSDDFTGFGANQSLANNTNEDLGIFTVFYTTDDANDDAVNFVDSANDELSLNIKHFNPAQTTEMTFKFDDPILGFGVNISLVNSFLELWTFTVDGDTFNISDVIDASQDGPDLTGFAGFRADNAVTSFSVNGLPQASSDAVRIQSVFVAVVPEPSSLIMLATGTLLLTLCIRRRRMRSV